MKVKYSLLLSLGLTLLLLFAACGSDDTGSSDSTGDDTNTEGDSTSSEEPEGDASEDVEQILVYARGGDSTSLDFANNSDGEASRVTKNIFDSLLSYAKDSFEVEPGLAYDWDIEDDGTRYIFYLEEGVTFHDGTEFNAEAVKINYERWADPDHEYHFKDEGYTYPLYGTMFGGSKGDENHVIKEINVLGDYEIEFVLKEPLGFFLQNVAMHYFAITSPAALEKYGAEIDQNPVGTGPFKFVSWSKDDKIVLEKFEDYRKEGLPKLDQLIYQVIPDNAARLIALRSGEVDIIDDVNPDDAASIESEDGLDLHVRGPNNVGFLGFNAQKEPLDNVLVRQAINYAVDSQSIVDALYAGYANTSVNLIPPNYLGHNDNLQGYEYDPAKAEELLSEAGLGDGFDIDLWVMPVSRPYMPDPEKVAEIVQHNLAEVGINVNIVREEWAPYLEKTSAGEHELFLLGWSGSNGDPDYFFSSLLHGDSIGGENRTYWENEKVNDLFHQAQVSVDQDERIKLYEEAQEIILEEAPMVNLVHSTPLVATSDLVKGFIPHPSTSDPMEEVYLGN